ncbi:P-selectin glycoprotein ligand 1-like [Gymnodraco acuticeps]|uniref:P-selectin glycoprotein ligand 1-like n=1 Tax=Gymnodraco acuticeps TaxID=8218 RepID=A0A6P8U952_GYMAC|nr:P-selectin glycoprotein ligand 1-like [Gymnodraco acuticeps]
MAKTQENTVTQQSASASASSLVTAWEKMIFLILLLLFLTSCVSAPEQTLPSDSFLPTVSFILRTDPQFCLNYLKAMNSQSLRILSLQDESSGTKTSSQKDASHFMSPDSGPMTLGFMCVRYLSYLMGVTLGDAGSTSLQRHIGTNLRLPTQEDTNLRLPTQEETNLRLPTQEDTNLRLPTQEDTNLRLPTQEETNLRLPTQEDTNLRLPTQEDTNLRLPTQEETNLRLPTQEETNLRSKKKTTSSQ